MKDKAKDKKVTLSLWGMRPNGEDLRAIADLMSKGIVRTHITRTHLFSSMPEVHKQIETRRSTGKIVV